MLIPYASAKDDGSPVEHDPNQVTEQLEINREALFNGSNQEIRITASLIMLAWQQERARSILLEAIEQENNPEARIAVCKSLFRALTEKREIWRKEDFILPLLKVVRSNNRIAVQFAAQASLMFDYDQFGVPLEGIVRDPNASESARLNAVSALQLRPDKRAAIALLTIAEDQEINISRQAIASLTVMGIPVGENQAQRRKILEDITAKEKDEFLRDWISIQQQRIQEERASTQLWMKLYFESLDQFYRTLSDEKQRVQYLLPNLTASQPQRRLWALERVRQARLDTNLKLTTEINPVLIDLVSDPDERVRLAVAEILQLIQDVNAVGKLIEQMELETVPEVKHSLFIALGVICDVALRPEAGNGLTRDIKAKTLEWAAFYLKKASKVYAREGSDVIRKLLEKNGIDPNTSVPYLQMVSGRFESEKGKGDLDFAGELLGDMASLCSERSDTRLYARPLYQPLFENLIQNDYVKIREKAVEGLIHCDPQKAVSLLKGVINNETSSSIKDRVIRVMKSTGTQEDLAWLQDFVLKGNGSSGIAWEAMLDILKRSDFPFCLDWMHNNTVRSQISGERWLSFLRIIEGKAIAANPDQSDVLMALWREIADIEKKSSDQESVLGYLNKMYERASDDRKKELLLEMMEIYLVRKDTKAVVDVIQKRLVLGDLTPDDPMSQRIEHIVMAHDALDPSQIKEVLGLVIYEQKKRPSWEKLIRKWLNMIEDSPTNS